MAIQTFILPISLDIHWCSFCRSAIILLCCLPEVRSSEDKLNKFDFVNAVLYANLSRIPSLLPSRRSEDQTKQAYKMLSDCFRLLSNTFLVKSHLFLNVITHYASHLFLLLFSNLLCFILVLFLIPFRYGMNTSNCRAKILVEYFGEEFSYKKCQLYVMFLFLWGCAWLSWCLWLMCCLCTLLFWDHVDWNSQGLGCGSLL